jgi:hypothetical protein
MTVSEVSLVFEGRDPYARVRAYDIVRGCRWSSPGYVRVRDMALIGEQPERWQIKVPGHKMTVANVDKQEGIVPGRSAADNELAMKAGVRMGAVDDALLAENLTRKDLLEMVLHGDEERLKAALPRAVARDMCGQHWCEVVGGERPYFFHTGSRRSAWELPSGVDPATVPKRKA